MPRRWSRAPPMAPDPRGARRRRPSGAAATHRCGGGPGGHGDPRVARARAGASVAHRAVSGRRSGGGRLDGGIQDSECAAEPVRRGRPVGGVRPRVRPVAGGRGGRRGEPGRRRGGRHSRADDRGVRADRCARGAAADLPDRPGLHRCPPRTHDRTHADPLSRSGAARALGVVPGRAQQPSPVSGLVFGADCLERGPDRRPGLVGPGAGQGVARRATRLGVGRREFSAVRGAVAGGPWARAGAAIGHRRDERERARGTAQLRPGVREPRRGADQQLHRSVSHELSAHRHGGGVRIRDHVVRASGEPVRRFDLGGGTAGDVAGHDRGSRGRAPCCGRA